MKKYMYLDTESFRGDEVIVVIAESSSEADDKMIDYLMKRNDYDEDEAKDALDEYYTELTVIRTLE